MKKTKEMIEREKATGNEFKEISNGYCVLEGSFWSIVIYISLPEGHPDIGKDYMDLNVNVNGGLTFANGNVFGWDYEHFENTDDYEGDIKRALEFFRNREDLK